MNRAGVKNLAVYLIPGAFIWYFIHHSGYTRPIAGVLTAFAIPTTPDAEESPLEKLEHLLVKPVNYLIMPLFALSNTNIMFEWECWKDLRLHWEWGSSSGWLSESR